MKLRPNCLLTRKPIFLIAPHRSIFYYKKPWGSLHNLLYQHGYKVEIFHLPFRGTHLRNQVLQKKIAHLQNAHIVIDPVSYAELKDCFKNLENSTLTIITHDHFDPTSQQVDQQIHETKIFNLPPSSSQNRKFSIYKLHQMYLKFFDQNTPDSRDLFLDLNENDQNSILDHFIKLAELDFTSDS